MSNKLRLCAALTSLGFAFYAVQDASAAGQNTTGEDKDIRDRVAQLHAAQDAGGIRVDIVGRLQDALGLTAETNTAQVKTADWLQTFNQQFRDRGTTG
jgi:hypothetical protein